MTRTAPEAEPAAGIAADASTLRALEFAAIVARLGELTAFAPSRELAEGLLPVADAAHVGLLQDQTAEAARLLDEQAQASIGGARDVRAAIERARRGGRLTAQELLDVAETAHATGQFGSRLSGWKGAHLAEVGETLDPAPDLRERIERSVDESGELLDSASSQLAAIRKRLRTAQDRVRERLNTMLRSSDLAGVIGEAIVTLRNGRYVIPIRAEAKGRVKGIVHDQSSSGATLFIEPLGVVELNNTWTQATLDAAREEERILDELSGMVEARADKLADSLQALARADLWMARARLAMQMDAVRPAIADDAAELLSARHPLLGAGAVPIDLRLGERFGYRALVVTGPNTGGKTVSLKTLGLLALMHQAGLRVPAADGARLPVFGRVMADIGDEQSIAQSLSTFSSHLRNVVRFVAAAGPTTLVLLDEIGAGTDPTEGSALAMAVVERLLAAGAMVAATTHYAELKAFAQEHPMVTNASVEFDVRTLRPTYRLEIGLPGKSQAFAIAERLGLPDDILEDARSRLAVEHVSMEQALAAIAESREARAAELELAQAERAAASDERERARTGVSRARREASEMLMEARRAADELLARAEREVAEVRRELTRQRNLAGGRRSTSRQANAQAFEDLAVRASRARGEAHSPVGEDEAPEEADADTVQPRAGLFGRSRTLGSSGRIVEVSGRTGRVTLETDEARIVLPADDVEVVPEPIRGPAPRDREADELRRRAASRIAPQLDLRGERVEAAIERLAAYVDEALLAGLDEAIIVHGAGTGALRRSIREYLAEHPRVRATRSGRREEGGDGATVAEL
ncbi:MAG TPA: endonuclease MutS2 [Candidatus Limnocylindria bacterium]|nr:endonuclease MutS2 [Candidatus Limnocylindria bacterium]